MTGEYGPQASCNVTKQAALTSALKSLLSIVSNATIHSEDTNQNRINHILF